MYTILIAQVLGIFFAVAGISMIAGGKRTAEAVEASVQNKGILWLWGIIALVIGAGIVVLNNMWTSGIALLVTIIGWLALVKGVFILLAPDAAASLYRKFNKSGLLVFCGVIALILGLVLLYW